MYINTGLQSEYINFINDFVLFLLFIFLTYFITDISKYIDLIKIIFIFILIKHLLLNQIILIT
jgi:hypothetical protein